METLPSENDRAWLPDPDAQWWFRDGNDWRALPDVEAMLARWKAVPNTEFTRGGEVRIRIGHQQIFGCWVRPRGTSGAGKWVDQQEAQRAWERGAELWWGAQWTAEENDEAAWFALHPEDALWLPAWLGLQVGGGTQGNAEGALRVSRRMLLFLAEWPNAVAEEAVQQGHVRESVDNMRNRSDHQYRDAFSVWPFIVEGDPWIHGRRERILARAAAATSPPFRLQQSHLWYALLLDPERTRRSMLSAYMPAHTTPVQIDWWWPEHLPAGPNTEILKRVRARETSLRDRAQLLARLT